MRTLFCTSFSFLTQGLNFKPNDICVARFWRHTFFLKQQIEVPSILLTTQTNLGKFTNALPLSTQASGQTVRIFCQVVVLFSFSKNTAISSILLLCTLFCTNIANLKMCPRFWPKKAIYENLYKNGKFQDLCTFLT